MILWFRIRLILLGALFTATSGHSQRLDSGRSSGFQAIDAAHLRADLAFLASPELEGRMTLYRGSRLAALFLAAEFAKAGLRPANDASYLQEFPVPEDVAEQIFRAAVTAADLPSSPDPPYSSQPKPPYTSVNVVGVLEGSDRTLNAETVILSAHYDHLGIIKGRVYPGADDNASGTVALLELARAFAKNRTRPKRTLLFIACGAEETFWLGSRFYVDHPLRPLETTRAVINFDIIGRSRQPIKTPEYSQVPGDTSNELLLVGTNYSPKYRQVVEEENRFVGLKLSYDLDGTSIFRRSDHYIFARRGIPAVRWTTGYHPDYHTCRDTVDKIDFEKLTKIVRLAYLAAWKFAEGRQPLEWTMPVDAQRN